MQRRTALIIDSYSLKSNFENIFTHFKLNNGRYLELFLNEARCETSDYDNDMERGENIEKYLKSKKIVYKNINLKNFDVFDPQNMPNPNDYASVRTYGIAKIKQLNDFFEIGDQSAILNQLQVLLKSIVSSSNYCQIKNG